ncbi:hypothetical protein WAI453_003171 [Rhynchosporium graminicola]
MANYTGGSGGQRNAQGGTNHLGSGAQYNSGGGPMLFGCNHKIPSGEDAVTVVKRDQPKFSTSPDSDQNKLQIQTSAGAADIHQQVLRLTRKEEGTLLLGIHLTPNPNSQGREELLGC